MGWACVFVLECCVFVVLRVLLLCVVWLSPHVCFVSLPTMRCSRAALVSCFPAAARVFSSDRAHHTTVQSSPASYNSPHPRNKKRAPPQLRMSQASFNSTLRNCGFVSRATQPSRPRRSSRARPRALPVLPAFTPQGLRRVGLARSSPATGGCRRADRTLMAAIAFAPSFRHPIVAATAARRVRARRRNCGSCEPMPPSR